MGRKMWAAAGLSAALVLAGVAVADSVLASRVESALARPGQRADVAGFPYAAHALLGKLPRVSVEQLDADLPGGGVGTLGVDVLDYVPVDPAQLRSGDFGAGEAGLARRRLRLDPVGFGELLGMSDLDLANPYDISPAGRSASEAQLTATVPGLGTRETAVVTLRLDQGVFTMRPSVLIGVSPEDEDAVVEAFTLTLDTRELPLGGPADKVQLVGGSIEFSHDRINTDVDAADFDLRVG